MLQKGNYVNDNSGSHHHRKEINLKDASDTTFLKRKTNPFRATEMSFQDNYDDHQVNIHITPARTLVHPNRVSTHTDFLNLYLNEIDQNGQSARENAQALISISHLHVCDNLVFLL